MLCSGQAYSIISSAADTVWWAVLPGNRLRLKHYFSLTSSKESQNMGTGMAVLF